MAKPDQIPRVLQIAAQFAGQLTNLSEIGRNVGFDHKTADHYMRVLEQLYLIQRVQPWADRTLFGPLLESFVFSELLNLSAWTEERVMLFHYRDRDQLEVDFVLENSAGEIVGIEVKSAASVTRRDFLGIGTGGQRWIRI